MSSANIDARVMIGPFSYRLSKCSPDEITVRNPIRALLEIEVDGKIDQQVVEITSMKICDVDLDKPKSVAQTPTNSAKD